MELAASLSSRAEMAQTQRLSPQMRKSLDMLAMTLPELRGELVREMQSNPVIEEVGDAYGARAESRLKDEEAAERRAADEWPEDGRGDDEAWEPDRGEADPSAAEEAAERRRRFFELQTANETLEEHLAAQLPSADIPAEDMPLARALVGELDSRGWFCGSVPDISMATGADARKIKKTLAAIMALDPPGCGAVSLEECLLAQIDALEGNPAKGLAEAILRRGMLAGAATPEGVEEAARALRVPAARVRAALAAIATLEPRPARPFAVHGKDVRFIRPEVRAVFSGGRWFAATGDSSLPEIRISPKYSQMLDDPAVGDDAKEYIRRKIAEAQFLSEAVDRREETLRKVAQAVFDAQSAFFTEGFKGLKPLTMQQIADATGLHHSTVSRAVGGKYAATPRGVVELRKFFVAGVATDSGGQASRDGVLDALKEAVAAEDPAAPLSDLKLSGILKTKGWRVERRTVAKYRGILGIPGVDGRRKKTKGAGR